MASTDAHPVPIKDAALRITFPILDADGDLVTGATTPDTEFSEDAATFADCSGEATEIATASGMYYVDLINTEMGGDTVAVIVKTATAGAKTTPIVLYPESAGNPINVNVEQISLDATAADNMELDYDGTGYAKANSTIGTTTTNTDMRGTDSAALASVLGALADAAVDGDPTATDTMMGYIKQLVNVLVGTAGVVTFPAAAAPGNAVSLAEILRSIYDDTNELQVDDTPGAISALNNLSAAEVNAEVLDVLNVDTFVESAGVPAATATIQAKIAFLATLARNKITQTATVQTLRNDADAGNIATAAVSDDATTATRSEWV